MKTQEDIGPNGSSSQSISPAAEALLKAQAWQSRIQTEGISQSQIAKQNNLTPARVSQVMGLLKLPDDLKRKILSGETETLGWSVRAVRKMGNWGDEDR